MIIEVVPDINIRNSRLEGMLTNIYLVELILKKRKYHLKVKSFMKFYLLKKTYLSII